MDRGFAVLCCANFLFGGRTVGGPKARRSSRLPQRLVLDVELPDHSHQIVNGDFFHTSSLDCTGMKDKWWPKIEALAVAFLIVMTPIVISLFFERLGVFW
jgi:hypothetical protein